MDDGNTDNKARVTKKCVIKGILKFNDYKNCLLNNEVIPKSQQRLQTFDGITSYPFDTSVEKVCKTEILSKYK